MNIFIDPRRIRKMKRCLVSFFLVAVMLFSGCAGTDKQDVPSKTEYRTDPPATDTGKEQDQTEEPWDDDGKFVYVSDLECVSWKMYRATSDDKKPRYVPNFNVNEQGGKITIAGAQYEKGIRTHPDEDGFGDIVYNIEGLGFKTFKSAVGKDSGSTGGGDIYFQVIGDGNILCESDQLFYGQSETIYADIRGVKILTLRVLMGTDIYCDSCAWADAKLCNEKIPEDKKKERVIYVTEKDTRTMTERYLSYFEEPGSFPVSFKYGDEKFSGFDDRNFQKVSDKKGTGRNSETRTLVFKLKKTDLQITVEGAYYRDYDACEWTVYFENTGKKNTEVLSDIRGADMFFFGEDPIIYGMRGDVEAQFASYTNDLTAPLKVRNTTGRPTHTTTPYFCLAFDGGGYNIAVSWQGCVAADFTKVKTEKGEGGVYFTDGQYGLCTYLKPGEKIRTPMTAIQEYAGTRTEAINKWRKWYFDCNMPEGWTPVITASSSWLYGCMADADTKSQLDSIDRYVNEDVGLDYWWMDAGWYQSPTFGKIGSWVESGNYNVDTERFPEKFADITEYAHKKGLEGTILWFEPEIFRTSFENMKKVYPEFKEEWTLGESSTLYDLGNPEAVEFLAKNVLKVLKEGNITVYRQDYNIDPAGAWAAHDEGKDRKGITENLYCQGYLNFWDTLLSSVPGLKIDNCASGGGRLDLESLRRSVPLHRTDFDQEESEIVQTMNMSLYEWIPFNGGPSNSTVSTTVRKYMLRSVFNSSVTLNYDIRNDKLAWKLLAGLVKELKIAQQYYDKDYYALTEWTRDKAKWLAWEFVDKARNEGVMEVFRRSKCDNAEQTLFPKGLKDGTDYYFCDFDAKTVTKVKGSEVNKNGFTVKLDKKSSATTVWFGTTPIEFPDYGEEQPDQGVADAPTGETVMLKDTPPEGAIMLSDLPWKYWRMYQANSEEEYPLFRPNRDSDEFGDTLMIGKYEFEKGIRTHVDIPDGKAEIIIEIGQYNCTKFRAIVGKENRRGVTGKIQFHIELDGKRIASSPILDAGESYEFIADIAGGKEINLVVTDGGDGITCDSAGWGNAAIY